jgi:aerobic-type carbon monoxide dehydrogenase small subunit (CoxS/CutS family)
VKPATRIELEVNGRQMSALAPPDRLLVDFLREELELTGTKFGCGTGDCGACAVLLDGVPVNACLIYAVECEGRVVETVESVSQGRAGSLVVDAFLRNNAVQCGICTPGFVVSAAGSLAVLGPEPDREQVETALAGNLCRCTGYYGILAAVQQAATEFAESGDEQ